MPLEDDFPNLNQTGYLVTSPSSNEYNCIAWAAGINDTWWEPDPFDSYYWPPDVPRRYTMTAYIQAFESLGFSVCDDPSFEPGFEKVALFATFDGVPRHAARQLSNGRWTSKLGYLEDIEHILDGLVGTRYGAVVRILKRPTSQFS
jgi:hypothetical protein